MRLVGFLAWTLVACFCLTSGASAASDPTKSFLRVHVNGDARPRPAMVLRLTPTDGRSAPHEIALGTDARGPVTTPLFQGDYTLSVALADGRTASLRLTIEAMQTSVVTATIAADPTTTLRLERVDWYRQAEGAAFSAEVLRELPTADDLWSLVETAVPFVVVDRVGTGGLGLGHSALMGSRGESWALTTVNVGGLQVRSPNRTGRLPVLPDMHAAEAVVVSSGLATVEVDTPGVVIDFIPKRPGRSWRGGVDLSLTTPGMVGENSLTHAPDAPSFERIEDWRDAGVFAGGPVTDSAGLFVSTGFTRATHLERETPPLFTSEQRTVLAHLVARPTAVDQVRVLAGFEGADRPYDDRRQFADPFVDQRSMFGRGQLTWEREGRNGSHRTIAFGYQRGAWRPDVVEGAAGGTMDRVLHGAIPPPPSDLTLTTWDGRAEWRAPMRGTGAMRHDLRAGITLRRSRAGRDVLALPVVAESVAGLPARVWTPIAADVSSHRSVTEGGLFVADRVALGPTFTMDLGLRADMARGSNGGATGLGWATVSPRVWFRWSPKVVSLSGGVGRYAGGHPLSFLTFGDPGEATWNVFRWTDPDADGVYDAGEAGVLVSRAGRGPGVAALDPDLRVPRTTEWVVSAEVRPTSYSILRGSIIIRRQTSLVGVVNTGLSPDDYRVFHVPDINHDEGSPHDDQLLPIYDRLPSSFGRDALVLTNPDADPIRHDGIELTYELSSPRWFVLFGGTAYRTLGRGGALGHGPLENDQLVPGDRFSNPNAAKDLEGRLFFDRAYVGKITTAYRAPSDVRIATVVRYQDGQPFTRFVVAPDLAGGPEIVHAYPVGRTRFTYTATLDLRLEKGVTWGTGRRASFRLDVFNLTNHANELEEDVLSGPDFRLASIIQPPRTLRLGVRLDF